MTTDDRDPSVAPPGGSAHEVDALLAELARVPAASSVDVAGAHPLGRPARALPRLCPGDRVDERFEILEPPR